MGVLIIEGTLEEIKKKLDALPHSPDKRLRVMVREALTSQQVKRVRNGISLVPIKDPSTIVTAELVKELLEAD